VNDVSPRAPLDLARLVEAAGDRWTVELHDAAGSTNDLAAADPRPGHVVVTDHQTAGKGRLGRLWVVPRGAALTFSAVVDPGVEDEWWPLVPLVAGDAVARAVDGAVKWPNDVLLADRKVCGILVERVHARPDGADRPLAVPLAVIGIGINVDQTSDELPVPDATSLALAVGPTDRAELLRRVLAELGRLLAVLAGSPATFVSDYRGRCDTLGREVRVDLPGGEVLQGTAYDVDDHGRLLVRSPSGTTAVAAGDVVHVRPLRSDPSG